MFQNVTQNDGYIARINNCEPNSYSTSTKPYYNEPYYNEPYYNEPYYDEPYKYCKYYLQGIVCILSKTHVWI